MIDSAFDLIKFQIINSFLTINSNDLTIFKTFSILIMYIFYLNRINIMCKLYEYFDNKHHVFIEVNKAF